MDEPSSPNVDFESRANLLIHLFAYEVSNILRPLWISYDKATGNLKFASTATDILAKLTNAVEDFNRHQDPSLPSPFPESWTAQPALLFQSLQALSDFLQSATSSQAACQKSTENEIEELKRRLTVTSHEHEIATKTWQSQNSALHSDLDVLFIRCESLSKELRSAKASLSDVNSSVSTQAEQLSDVKNRLATTLQEHEDAFKTWQTQNSALRDERDALLMQRDSLSEELQSAHASIGIDSSLSVQMEQRSADLKKSHDALAQERDSLIAKIDSMEKSHSAKIQASDSRSVELAVEVGSLRYQLQEKEKLQAECTSLNDLLKNARLELAEAREASKVMADSLKHDRDTLQERCDALTKERDRLPEKNRQGNLGKEVTSHHPSPTSKPQPFAAMTIEIQEDSSLSSSGSSIVKLVGRPKKAPKEVKTKRKLREEKSSISSKRQRVDKSLPNEQDHSKGGERPLRLSNVPLQTAAGTDTAIGSRPPSTVGNKNGQEMETTGSSNQPKASSFGILKPPLSKNKRTEQKGLECRFSEHILNTRTYIM